MELLQKKKRCLWSLCEFMDEKGGEQRAWIVNKRKANWSSFYTLEMLSMCVLENLIKIENYSNTNFSKLK